MKKSAAFVLSVILAATSSAASAQQSPRLQGVYNVGGGFMPRTPTKSTLQTSTLTAGIGVSWKTDMICGDMEPLKTVQNQLNAVSDGFEQMFGNLMQAATGVVASLPGIILQRANPGLYDMIASGAISAKADFDLINAQCDDLAAVVGDNLPWESVKTSQKQQTYARAIENATLSGIYRGDASHIAKTVRDASHHGNRGVPWICGDSYGGAGQPAIRAIQDTVIAGYNLTLKKTGSRICDWASYPSSVFVDSPMFDYWPAAMDAAVWARDVMGEARISTCAGCPKLQTTPGFGLIQKLRMEKEDIETRLHALANGTTAPVTFQRLQEVSAPPGVQITGVLVRHLGEYPMDQRVKLIDQISSEVAWARIHEQSRLIAQIIRTGMKEPNVAANQDFHPYIETALRQLEQDLDQLRGEHETRKEVKSGTILRLMASEEKRIQQGEIPLEVKPITVNPAGAGEEL